RSRRASCAWFWRRIGPASRLVREKTSRTTFPIPRPARALKRALRPAELQQVVGRIEIEGRARHRHFHQTVRVTPEEQPGAAVALELAQLAEKMPREDRRRADRGAIAGGRDAQRLAAPRAGKPPQVLRRDTGLIRQDQHHTRARG